MKLKISIEKIKIEHAADIYQIMQLVLKREEKVNKGREHFWVIALNNDNRIINLELISMGSSTHTIVEPMEVLSIPLQKKAAGLVLVHNHPSGNIKPSEDDKDITNRLIQACKIMRTPVLDHVIITEHSYYSFKDSGLLELLEGSTKYMMPYDLEKQYFLEMQEAIKSEQKKSKKKIQESLKKGKEEGIKEGLKEGIKQEKIEIAKSMLSKGLDITLIQQVTNLSKHAIDELANE
jgi:DNA repair protein RadC